MKSFNTLSAQYGPRSCPICAGTRWAGVFRTDTTQVSPVTHRVAEKCKDCGYSVPVSDMDPPRTQP